MTTNVASSTSYLSTWTPNLYGRNWVYPTITEFDFKPETYPDLTPEKILEAAKLNKAIIKEHNKTVLNAQPQFFGHIDKIIFAGKKTIVLFSYSGDKQKVILTNNDDTVLSLYDTAMLAVLKRASKPEQWSFFSKYVTLSGNDAEKLLKDYARTIASSSFWEYWQKHLKHIFFEISEKERNKMLIIQPPKQPKEPTPAPKKRGRKPKKETEV